MVYFLNESENKDSKNKNINIPTPIIAVLVIISLPFILAYAAITLTAYEIESKIEEGKFNKWISKHQDLKNAIIEACNKYSSFLKKNINTKVIKPKIDKPDVSKYTLKKDGKKLGKLDVSLMYYKFYESIDNDIKKYTYEDDCIQVTFDQDENDYSSLSDEDKNSVRKKIAENFNAIMDDAHYVESYIKELNDQLSKIDNGSIIKFYTSMDDSYESYDHDMVNDTDAIPADLYIYVEIHFKSWRDIKKTPEVMKAAKDLAKKYKVDLTKML